MMRLLFIVYVFSVTSYAFMPSVPNMVKEVLEGRNTRPTYIGLRHRVRTGSNEFNEVEEQIFQDRGRTQFVWRTRGQVFTGSRTKDGYALDADHRISSHSSAFLRYLLSSSADELLTTLAAEGFIRPSQMQTYKAGFVMENDPATWNLKENFLIQPDVFLVRLPTDVAIAVHGQGDDRVLYIENEYRGIRRLEWKEGEKLVAWNFQQFAGQKNLGSYPKLLSLEVDGQVQVESSLVAVHTADSKKQPKPVRSNASIGGSDESLLAVLLSYR